MKLKLPSFKEISHSFSQTFTRFPIVLLYSFVISIYGIVLVHADFTDLRFYYALHVLSLGIFFSAGLSVFFELKDVSKILKISSNIGVFLLLVGYFFTFQDFFVAKIIIVLSLPYFAKNNQLNYWRFNFDVFNRFILSTFFSMIIYAGISIALGVINLLFNAEISSEIFADLWIIIIGMFAVTNFLSGFPKQFYYSDEFDYPKALRIFVQFILVPLTTIYLAILYAYIIKILFTWELPQGYVSYLVLSFSAVGLLALMIIYPIKDNIKYKWISTFGKYFFLSILPLIILLFISIFIRINQYGITENRYYVVIFAVWLTAIAIYSLATKFKNIKIIAISFSVLFLIISYGPWSSFNIGKISQLNKLNKIITEYNILPNGEISSDTIDLPDSVYNHMYDISDYLIENHGLNSIEKEFDVDLQSIDTLSYSTAWDFMDFLNIEGSYTYNFDDNDTSNYYFSISGEWTKLDISDYDFAYNFNIYNYDYDSTSIDLDSIKIEINNDMLIINFNSDETRFNLKSFVENKVDDHNDHYVYLEQNEAEIPLEINDNKFKLVIFSFVGNYYEYGISNTSFSGILLVDYPE